MNLNKLVEFFDNYLQISEIEDSCWNGLQFEGKKDVKKIVFAVDAGKETFNKAVSLKADMIVVHHGHFWTNLNPSVVSWSKERLELLYKHNISLYACHLPLDRHKEVGNNSQILQLLGATITEEFLNYGGKNIGWIGELANKTNLDEIILLLNNELKTNCKVLPFGKKKVQKIAVCSGGGGYSGFNEAMDKKVDLYISGDAIEVFYTAKDAKLNVIFAGHHATETLGLIAFLKVIEEKFSLECFFLDLPTGL
ncbi:MAG: Nif3-like dinuclear metal center hexameric protein [Candidatus Dadabacteria bacterium]|nr:Nif3-like dinuclear metal center hexameric protein [Candidatus Dadabacteria bacterium]NIQ14863.1 Nif3-like dinuclear metal center hexameric protein [Candidatus Dadabacteria bacterium]